MAAGNPARSGWRARDCEHAMGSCSILDAVGEISYTAHSPIRAKADVRVAAGGTPDQ